MENNGIKCCLQTKFPQLHSFAKSKEISDKKAAAQSSADITELFHLPLSEIANQQCIELGNLLENNIQTEDNDRWYFQWGNYYSTKKIYEAILNPPTAPSPFKWIWKSCCLSKHKFFFWLLLLDRLNTKDLMARKNFYVENIDCVLCDDEQRESMMHLFFECEFSVDF